MLDLEKRITLLESAYDKISTELSLHKQYNEYLASQLDRMIDKLKTKILKDE